MAARRLASQKKASLPALRLASTQPISPTELSDGARKAAEEILIAGESENTRRTYRSALRYWCAWAMARYGKPLALPVPVRGLADITEKSDQVGIKPLSRLNIFQR